MDYLSLILGVIIFITVISDLAYTTFSPFGAGKIANAITKTCWNISLKLSGNTGTNPALKQVGIVAIGLVIMVWFLLIWLGSSLIFLSDEHSIVHAQTGVPASTAEKYYFTGFTLSTLGVGDFVPNTDGWRIFTVILSLAGFGLITTAISYMLPVLSADVYKKSISRYILNLGNNPQEILKNHWIDGNFTSMEPHLIELMKMIITHSQQLLAYPILYCFHDSDPVKSTAVNIAKIDEALSILLVQVPESDRPNPRIIFPLRRAITSYLIVQKDYFLRNKEAQYDVPELESLHQADLPFLDRGDKVQERYRKIEKRRKLIGAMLKNEGWTFEDIYSDKSPDYGDGSFELDEVE
jgi:hypothetical protein